MSITWQTLCNNDNQRSKIGYNVRELKGCLEDNQHFLLFINSQMLGSYRNRTQTDHKESWLTKVLETSKQ